MELWHNKCIDAYKIVIRYFSAFLIIKLFREVGTPFYFIYFLVKFSLSNLLL